MRVLDTLAQVHFPHLGREEGHSAVVRLLDTLDNATLAQARFERHHGAWATNPDCPHHQGGERVFPEQEAPCPTT